MKYLFVVAHPDDECDGAGATIYKLTNQGNQVAVAIMVGNAEARRNLSETLIDDEKKSMSLLGVNKVFRASYPNIQMNTVPFSDMVGFVEECIEEWKPNVIITHHPSDTNNDHAITSVVVQEAVAENNAIDGFYYLEASSATEWALNTNTETYKPDVFIEIDTEGMEIKLKALSCYAGVSRPYPHPQCKESYYGLAALRGCQSGCKYAESYKCVFRRVK